MKRFYHKMRSINLSKKHKILAATLMLFLLLIVYFFPLFPYIPTTAKFIWRYIRAADNLKQNGSRTNILLLGLDGRSEELGSNTDTVIFSSIDRAEQQSLMLSVPRDIWIEDLKTKINDVYSAGNRTEGNGLEEVSNAVSTIVGQPVHYSLAISFDGFVKIIDTLGGVDIMVDRSFMDDSYPIMGRENDTCGGDTKTLCRWEILTFNKGPNHFDGATALKFARSRHSRGEEGTDFARAARQQKIIAAVKQKLFSPQFLFNPPKIRQMLDIVNSSLDTDIPQSEYALFAKLALKIRNTKVNSQVIPWDQTNNTPTLLYHPEISPKFNNEWVLLPITDSWEPIRKWVECLYVNEICKPEEFLIKK